MTTSHVRLPSHVRAERSPHEHAWSTESGHPTSSGHILYVRCEICGVRRVDLQQRYDTPPAPLSKLLVSR
ncbi:hypothetical protein EXU48_02355 [Occultella glacieicola]|uniref:Transcriptional regulator n=1 Tax=Occultella glacieicola TaxID=2518684 RepID=A0ABY2E9I6_9MICO|nr:hypothetical protein [Occultella glacieicola]TDE99046.1 hypothetical protein EXU48_02355 [Occultella glacieicola]